MPRRDGLPTRACWVVEASTVLPWGMKAVWLRTYWLDIGPERTWATERQLGAMLGLEPATVARYRTELRAYGLLESAEIPGDSGQRRVQRSWWCTLPAPCIPPDRARPDHCVALARVLDQHLSPDGPDGKRRDHDPPSRPMMLRPEGRSTSALKADHHPALGERKGAPPAVKGTEVPSTSAVREGDRRRRVARNPEAEGDARARGPQSVSADVDRVMERLRRERADG